MQIQKVSCILKYLFQIIMVFSFHTRMIVVSTYTFRGYIQITAPGPTVQVSNRFKWYNRWTWLTKACFCTGQVWHTVYEKATINIYTCDIQWRKSTRCKRIKRNSTDKNPHFTSKCSTQISKGPSCSVARFKLCIQNHLQRGAMAMRWWIQDRTSNIIMVNQLQVLQNPTSFIISTGEIATQLVKFNISNASD